MGPMAKALPPSLFDFVTGINFIGVEWPAREGQPIPLPANGSLDAFTGSILRLVNLDPSLQTGAQISYTIGPQALSIDFERDAIVNGESRSEAVRMAFVGKARVPKVRPFTGLAKGFEIKKQDGIVVGVNVDHPSNPTLNYEQLAFFTLPKKAFSNHVLARALSSGIPGKVASLMRLSSLYISNPGGFQANQEALFNAGVSTFSPVVTLPSGQDRNAFIANGVVATMFFQAGWQNSLEP